MPRHLISDAHEWINEIPTVPIYEEQSAGEIPLLLSFFYLFGEAELDLNVHFLALRSLFCRSIRAEDTVTLGVWLGRHDCQMITQVS